MREMLLFLIILGLAMCSPVFGQIMEPETTTGTISETAIDTLALLFLLFGTYFGWDLYLSLIHI